ncbi:hypothetical protein [Hymenobacter crusticola]|uniref:Uncharacterized protein n=1 Tax=Hymenobacter crusticola TaxID=1770526 RepID=A0A2C9ZU35_9BACT|nr:hypothetical protein [Hymenobacter crusticola]OUJ70178.1 hypothetical protein BXP70_25345 [Hymenobacter crusticola]
MIPMLAVGELTELLPTPGSRKKAQILKFPVKKHLVKYLAAHLGEDYSLSERDQFGALLFHLLRNGLKDCQKDSTMDQYKGRFNVRLSRYPMKQYGLKGMNSNTVFLFNNYVDGLFRSELFAWVEIMGQRMDMTTKDAIIAFMDIYDLEEEDISFETLKKAVQREQNALKKAEQKAQKPPKKTKKSVARLSRKNRVLSLTKELDKVPLPLTQLIAQLRAR